MADRKILERELEHLHKTYKAGIINRSEYERVKAKIEQKLKSHMETVSKKEKSDKAVEEILTTEIKRPKVEPAEKPEIQKKPKKAPKKTKKTNKIAWIAGILIIIGVFATFYLLNARDPSSIVIPKDLTNATEGTIMIEFYSSYSCQPCYDSFMSLEEIKKLYGDKVEIVYLYFPLELEQDVILDIAAECASEQDAFEQYSRRLFEMKKPADRDALIRLAQRSGLDIEAFTACMDDRQTLIDVTDIYRIGLAEGIDTLPAVTIDGNLIYGAKPTSVYEIIIDSELGLI